ncbi:hypothetical protein ERO13_D07G059350v2 [Gossypium hirsutum]|uniref:Uncharacterized protein n=4 Tax=Gossypium TaxID=3633 RepID=A0A5J5QPR4_GOSBA|nr:hypothetical protein ES319_D07G062100v1 [Gossypium barbadense]KAG4137239.1 hypothetical protein ERO13_D07G059350v2 [Gossypium hirsutum]TYG60397.1 hypothetical protein ES288_D07G065300v1 [Gossypium darwinii]TYH61622.1 hypothetical protein ES332_D07G065100v1 [Gossypium tomentosum]TYI72478.1 hypothetical protein E1A91_D07G064200v1 [Gossypium mustelinum]
MTLHCRLSIEGNDRWWGCWLRAELEPITIAKISHSFPHINFLKTTSEFDHSNKAILKQWSRGLESFLLGLELETTQLQIRHSK